MYDYELTDRGKVALAVILALLFFFLPSAIIILSTVASPPPDIPVEDDSKASVSPPASPFETPPSVTAESPPPNGGGSNPPDTPPPTETGSGEHGADGGQSPSTPPGSGQGSVNSIEGTLSFLFSPYEYDRLDAGIYSMLDEFLTSPKNTRDNMIAVETPKLTDEIGEILIPAIADALSSKGVEEGRIEFISNQRIPLADAFEVNLYYLPQRGK